MSAPELIDLYVACTPCQPYSGIRSHGPVAEMHPGYCVAFGEHGSVLSQLRAILPQVFVTEQVKGFDKPHKGSTEESPMKAFISEVMSIERPDGNQHFASNVYFDMDSSILVEGSRPRSLGRQFAYPFW